MHKKALVFLLVLVTGGSLFAQHSSSYRIPYDDSTLEIQGPMTLMPFNREVRSAGKVVNFGDPRLENHALDFALLPDGRHLAVEDRYGVAILDLLTQEIVQRWSMRDVPATRSLMSTYSGIKTFVYEGHTYLVWGAGTTSQSALLTGEWDGSGVKDVTALAMKALAPAASALPNDIAVRFEAGIPYLYFVLNGNNQLVKMRFADRQIVWTVPTGVAPFGLQVIGDKAYVTNWAGPQVTDSSLEHAGTPWGSAYTNPVTGATSSGSLSIIDAHSGGLIRELPLGLHPSAIACSPDSLFLYVCNGNSDNVSVVDVRRESVADSIPVGLFSGNLTYYGSSPNALTTDAAGTTLYVTNGFDNAVCVVRLGNRAATHGLSGPSKILGYIPTEAYPGGVALVGNTLYVANIEARGPRVLSTATGLKEGRSAVAGGAKVSAYTIHQALASVSIIPVPSKKQLKNFSRAVRKQNLIFRLDLTNRTPRRNVAPRPVPERIGEPSVFKHVVYIIKENKTYDQVYGDVPQGRGMPDLCVYGDSVTPNQHRLVKDFSLLDNYYASGKCSAEGHQWADAAMTSDYVEKMVRAWFRSYPHRQEDALVYNRNGFIWNNALDHGRKVRIYGEACTTHYDPSLKWGDIYKGWQDHRDQGFRNTTTIGRIRPIISPGYPDCDNLVFTDQLRADIFIHDWKAAEQSGGDSLPDLMVLSLPDDHTAGIAQGMPVPEAMVADNDLAVGRIIDAITHSRFWDSTVVFITEDDSQSGWDHISAYRTTGLVISPYSVMGHPIHTNYNQTGMVRTIEQILGIPPMNVMDATALPLFDCFSSQKSAFTYTHVANVVPLDRMNRPIAALKGKAASFAHASAVQAAKGVDGGNDDLMNRILWFAAKGDVAYPGDVAH
jgi:YVTN family beta-propeller protein